MQAIYAASGDWRSLPELRAECDAGRDGVSAVRLMATARHHGHRATAVKIGPENLGWLPAGAILYWNRRHYVLFLRATRDGIELLDPSQGLVRVDAADVAAAHGGVAIVIAVEPRRPAVRAPSRWRPLKTELRAHRARILVAVLVSAALRLMAVVPALLSARAVDRSSTPASALVAVVIGVGASYLLVVRARGHLLTRLRTLFDLGITARAVTRITALPTQFLQRRGTNDLLLRLRSIALVRDAGAASSLAALIDFPFFAFYCITFWYVSVPRVRFAVAVLVLIHLTFIAYIRRRLLRSTSRYLASQITSQTMGQQMLSALVTFKGMGLERRAAQHYMHTYENELRASASRFADQVRADAWNISVRIFAPVLVLAVAATSPGFDISRAVASATLTATVFEPLIGLVGGALALTAAAPALDRLNDIFDEPLREESFLRPCGSGQCGLQVREVSYRYPGSRETAVHGVDLTIPRGEWLALVGPSGCGKTTLALLAVGLLEPTAGTVLWNSGDAIRPPQVGVVLQDTQLMSGSIRDNILLGRPLDDDAVWSALDRCKADELVRSLPMGLDTVLSDAGNNLSGGQRQRLGIARAIVEEPDLLLLDEATGQLDPDTALLILRNLRDTSMTVICVTHDQQVASIADRTLHCDHLATGTRVDSPVAS